MTDAYSQLKELELILNRASDIGVRVRKQLQIPCLADLDGVCKDIVDNYVLVKPNAVIVSSGEPQHIYSVANRPRALIDFAYIEKLHEALNAVPSPRH